MRKSKNKKSVKPTAEDLQAITDFAPCIKCKALTEINHRDHFGRCPTCGIA